MLVEKNASSLWDSGLCLLACQHGPELWVQCWALAKASFCSRWRLLQETTSDQSAENCSPWRPAQAETRSRQCIATQPLYLRFGEHWERWGEDCKRQRTRRLSRYDKEATPMILNYKYSCPNKTWQWQHQLAGHGWGDSLQDSSLDEQTQAVTAGRRD